jgi:hypothetical protein
LWGGAAHHNQWQQYIELGGLQNNELPEGKPSVPYPKALEALDEHMPTYIHDNTEDEKSHVAFLNAYLEFRGGEPVDPNHFLTLPSSRATGARQVKRLTNHR